jgi:hypothetical protein
VVLTFGKPRKPVLARSSFHSAECGTGRGLSSFLNGATLKKIAKLVLGIEPYRHPAFAVRDRDRKLPALAFVAAALLDDSARTAGLRRSFQT